MKLFKCFIYSTMMLSISVSSCKKKTNEEPLVEDPGYILDESALINAGYTKVFNEDFATGLSQWNIWQGGAYNNEYQYYSNSSSNLSISNGTLVITAKKETVTGATTNSNSASKSFDFTSGRIESKTLYSSNSTTPKMRFSARIKLPAGYGMWPAFWSYGANWPTNGEIDVMEAKGDLPYQYGTNYFYGSTAGVNQVTGGEQTITSTQNLTTTWHVYEVIWEQNKLTYLLDGVIVSTKTGTYISSMFGKSQMITLNLAIGGDYFGNPPASSIATGTMYVDWVKVFSSL